MPVLVRVVLEFGTVHRAEVEPAPMPKSGRVPVMAADTRGVTDPIGMLAVPVESEPLMPSL